MESPADSRSPGFLFSALQSPPVVASLLANAATMRALRSRASSLLQGGATVVLLALAVVACDRSDKPYLAFAGGGFVFNYRLATADYGFVANVERLLPVGSVLEATFEDPAGGPPIVLRQESVTGRRSYHFQTPPLQGVEADRDYRVVLRLLDAQGGELQRIARHFRSQVSQDVLPARPPVVGPGYQPAPAAAGGG